MQGGPSLCDRLGPRTKPGPRSSTTSPNPKRWTLRSHDRFAPDCGPFPTARRGPRPRCVVPPTSSRRTPPFLSLTTAKTRSSPRRTAPNKAEIAYDPLRKSETNPPRRLLAASYKPSYRECAGGRPLFRSLGKRRRRTPDTTESTSREESQRTFLRVGDDPLRALRRAPRHRLFTHFPDGGNRRRSSSNQFSSIVTCRSTLASFGCSCGSHAMMRVPSGVS